MPLGGNVPKGITDSGLPFTLFLLGSCPDASKRRAFSAVWRASASDTVGYLPIESVLRLPLCEKSNRHNFPTLVLIYRYKPLPSFSLNGFLAVVQLHFYGIFSRYFSDTAKDTVNFRLIQLGRNKRD